MASSTLAYGSNPAMYPKQGTEQEYDIEKSLDRDGSVDKDGAQGTTTETRDAAPSPDSRSLDNDSKYSGPFGKVMKTLGSYGVEETGIERVMPSERSDQHPSSTFTMWMAANTTVSTFALGTLGNHIWYMGLRDAILTILFFNAVFTLVVAFFSTWGPKTGMRQLALSRFGFGYYTVMIPTILNCIACIGWSVINTIAGASALRAVSYDSTLTPIPEAAAVVVIAISTLLVSFMGYKIVHAYEKYSWLPVLIILIVYAGFIGSSVTVGDWGGSGSAEAASVLSFGASIVGFAIGWSSLAADYSCKLKEDTPAKSVFLYTYAGLNIPMIGIEILGACAMATFTKKPEWGAAYENAGIGGLLAAPLIDRMGGGGRFFMVILALSIIANNIPNVYSFGLTFQVLGPWAQKIPRPLLSLVCTGIYLALAIAGFSSFSHILDTLLILLAYWLAIYSVIMLEEHFVFRAGSFTNWNFEDINNPKKLPLGVAALVALLVGWAGAVLGMSSVWYAGPISLLISRPFGGDCGFLLSGAFAGVVYPPLRYVEKRYWKY